MAADVLGWPRPTLRSLVEAVSWGTRRADFGVVETVGGVRSPVADDADSAALIAALSPDLTILVADAGLGTINAVRLSAEALGDVPIVVWLNRFDDSVLHEANRTWLTGDGFESVVDADEACRWIEATTTHR